ncbi:MAG: AAA family ATPase, partial [Hyphomicrobiales bacterium]
MNASLATTVLIAAVAVTISMLLGRLWRELRAARLGPAAPAPPALPRQEMQRLVVQLNELFVNTVATPDDLETEPRFQRLIALLEPRSSEDLIRYVQGTLSVPTCAALLILARRDDELDVAGPILDCISEINHYPRIFALRTLEARAKEPILPRMIDRLNPSWQDAAQVEQLRSLFRARLAAGESPDVFGRLDPASDQAEFLGHFLRRVGEAAAPLYESWRAWRAGGASGDLSVGTDGDGTGSKHPPAVPTAVAEERPIDHEALRATVDRLESNLTSSPPRSTLLVGDPLVGKTTALRALAARLREKGWTILETSAADLIADQSHVGQIEGRVRELTAKLVKDQTLWIVPEFIELLWAGRHSQSPTGLLDMFLPHVESGRIRLAGEVRTSSFDRLMQMAPRLQTTAEVLRLEPLGDAETLAVSRSWAERARQAVDEGVLQESLQLAKQFTRAGAFPGSVLRLLGRTRQRMLAEQRGRDPIRLDDVHRTLSEQTGIPVAILDERHELDLRGLRAFFDERILAQDEAVECLIERIAMVKAGLTDPWRPTGVFLFVGPTGTGKTAVAKALAEYLFGSPDRMIRLDMSEFQTEESLTRLLGSGGSRAHEFGTSLVQSIRSQPFAVILLDEFEKAHARIWDLFLQVFDDGRLTDRWGETADFRHAIIILTSNLGAAAGKGPGIGFSGKDLTYSETVVRRAVDDTFRPEFLNRFDRVVVFRPLHRAAMRQVLEKELRLALKLRGLRTRDWAVEWDETAVDFLLARGFTHELGARPLKRAIERYFLAPLSETIVARRYPEGDQFVFVHARGDRLIADFVDPDAADDTMLAGPEAVARVDALRRGAAEGAFAEQMEGAPARLSLRSLARGVDGVASELEFLEGEYRHLAAEVEGDAWQARKREALAAMGSDGFWGSPDRFRVLALAEYMDRIEAGVKRAGGLLGRLARPDAPRDARLPRDLVQRLAHQLYLLDGACAGLAAGKGRDAYLLVEASRDSQTPPEEHDAFAREIGAMYERWAKARGMKLIVADEQDGDAHRPYRLLLDVSGYAAFPILEGETGMHVLETPDARHGYDRARAYVRVVPQPDGSASPDRAEMEAALRDGADDAARRTIVRRYRREPSPLVRDSVRGWRTGRLDLVLEG